MPRLILIFCCCISIAASAQYKKLVLEKRQGTGKLRIRQGEEVHFRLLGNDTMFCARKIIALSDTSFTVRGFNFYPVGKDEPHPDECKPSRSHRYYEEARKPGDTLEVPFRTISALNFSRNQRRIYSAPAYTGIALGVAGLTASPLVMLGESLYHTEFRWKSATITAGSGILLMGLGAITLSLTGNKVYYNGLWKFTAR